MNNFLYPQVHYIHEINTPKKSCELLMNVSIHTDYYNKKIRRRLQFLSVDYALALFRVQYRWNM